MSIEVLSCRGLRPQCGKVDRDLWLWFCEAKEKFEKHGGPRVTKRMVQDHAKQTFQEAGISGFKASDGWYVRWMKRWRRLGNSADNQGLKKNTPEKPVTDIPPAKRKIVKKAKKINLGTEELIRDTADDVLQTVPFSSESRILDKMQILHDVASRELAGAAMDENCVPGHQSNLHITNPDQMSFTLDLSQSHGPIQEESTLLDFDQITWNDLPYLEQTNLPHSCDISFRIEENSGHYNSSIFSQMNEFAEICHMKEQEMMKEMSQELHRQEVEDELQRQSHEGLQHVELQEQLRENTEHQHQSLHSQQELQYLPIQDGPRQHSEEDLQHSQQCDSHLTNTSSDNTSLIEGIIQEESQDTTRHSLVPSQNGFLLDTMFYSLGDDSLSILDTTLSKAEQDCISIVLENKPHPSEMSSLDLNKDSITDSKVRDTCSASVSDYILPNNALVETAPSITNVCVSEPAHDLPSSPYPMHLEADSNGDSAMLLFTQSPFSFSDDSIGSLMTFSTSGSSMSGLPSVSEQGTGIGVDDLSLGYLHLMDSVLMQENKTQQPQETEADNSHEAPLDQRVKPCDQDTERELNVRSSRRMGGERYLPYFKERVLSFASQNTAKEAAKKFGVHVDTVTLWAHNKQQNNKMSKPPADFQLLSWLRRNRECSVQVTRDQVRDKALDILKTFGTGQKDKNRWFHVWASRFASDDSGEGENQSKSLDEKSGSLSDKASRSSKALYPEEFKLEVVLFAERTSQNLAASVFNIARKRVFDWMAAMKTARKVHLGVKENGETHSVPIIESGNKAFDCNTTVPGTTSHQSSVTGRCEIRGRGFGRAVTSVAVDSELWDWFCEQTAKRSKPKSREIREKAVELFRAHNFHKIRCSHGWYKKWSVRHGIALRYEGDSDLVAWCLEQFDHNRNVSHRDLLNRAYHVLAGTHKSDFKASAGWALRFCKRHRSLLSARPSVEVELPAVLKRHVTQFRARVQQLVHSPGMTLQNVGAMDEIPLNFTAAGSGGSRGRLLLRRSGLENCHANLVLCCTADGTLLPPAIIFKGDGPPEQVMVGNIPVTLFHQEEACMDPTVMKQWLNAIWFQKVTAPSVLIMDCYEPHVAESVKELCENSNCNIALIPAGCSSKLQPLEVAISRQFESAISARWAKHFAALDNFVVTKRTLYSNNADILQWVGQIHAQLQENKQEAIHRSFLVTGLTVALNHTEDHFIDNLATMPDS